MGHRHAVRFAGDSDATTSNRSAYVGQGRRSFADCAATEADNGRHAMVRVVNISSELLSQLTT